MNVKICGLSTPETVAGAARAGASHVGFIFFARSPRHVEPGHAAVCASAKGSARSVAVTVDADDATLGAIVRALDPDMVQLHGRETPERVEALRARFDRPVIKAIAMRDAADLERVRLHDGIADILLLDAPPPEGAELPGGNGVGFDWSLVEGLQTRSPVWLSGGIDETNIERAAAIARDPSNRIVGLDLSSGAESAPGVKDMARIDRLMRLAGMTRTA